MKQIISILILALACQIGSAQSYYDDALREIEANSLSLKSLAEQAEAQKLLNRTGIFPANPEVEFNYLWGSPSSIGNRTDFSVKQTIDFPTAYAYRSDIASLQNKNAELLYKSERLNLLLTAKKSFVNLVYYNALASEYVMRLSNARQITETYRKRIEVGDVNIMELNKAELNLIIVENEAAGIQIEQEKLLAQLKQLNGGKDIRFEAVQYPKNSLPVNFETWYADMEARNPVLHYVKQQVKINEKRVKLNQALGLPKISGGYMSEKIVGQTFRGVSAGISIPLWENKNRVKQAQAEVKASQTVVENTQMQFYNRLKALFVEAVSLHLTAENYRKKIDAFSNEQLLKKALDKGEISLTSYLLEVEYLYNAINKILEVERDLELTKADLKVVEL